MVCEEGAVAGEYAADSGESGDGAVDVGDYGVPDPGVWVAENVCAGGRAVGGVGCCLDGPDARQTLGSAMDDGGGDGAAGTAAGEGTTGGGSGGRGACGADAPGCAAAGGAVFLLEPGGVWVCALAADDCAAGRVVFDGEDGADGGGSVPGGDCVDGGGESAVGPNDESGDVCVGVSADFGCGDAVLVLVGGAELQCGVCRTGGGGGLYVRAVWVLFCDVSGACLAQCGGRDAGAGEQLGRAGRVLRQLSCGVSAGVDRELEGRVSADVAVADAFGCDGDGVAEGSACGAGWGTVEGWVR